MNEGIAMLVFGFIVFHISAHLGKQHGQADLKKQEQELKSHWDVQRKRLDEEERKLNARKSRLDQDVEILKQQLEECREELRLTKAKISKTSIQRIKQLQEDLDLYVQSRYKSTWQIGRDYELFVGQRYITKGYSVDFYGIRKGFEDKGIDIIAKNDQHTLLIQCKYWKHGKVLHENIVHQLYGSAMAYCQEHNVPTSKVKPILVTNVTLTEDAKDVCAFLGVQLVQRFSMEDFPRIKCCIQQDTHGSMQKFYYLPFDESYDEIMPLQPGEQFVKTVQEAEDLGFERA